MARPVLKTMSTEYALLTLEEYGVIRALCREKVTEHGKETPGWYFVVSATGDTFRLPTPKARAAALSLQQNLNIVYDGLSGTQTTSGSRVFWPGDELPQGIYVMGRDGQPALVQFPRTRVSMHQPDPLVEIILPNYERVIREGWVRRQAKGLKSA